MDTICNVQVAVPNAPDLVLDLLEAHGGSLSGHAICAAGVLLGHRETTMRVALTRLLAGGKIGRQARGRYALNPAGLKLSGMLAGWAEGAAGAVDWQEAWLAVHDGHLARSDKTVWRRHQLALQLRGFAAFEPGLKVRPANRRGGVEAERQVLRELGLAPQASVFLLSGWTHADAERACRLWPAAQLQRDYARWREALNAHGRLLPHLPEEQALRESLLLGRAAVSLLVRDPLLPPALMPPKPRDALAGTLHVYRARAHRLWSRWLSEAGCA